MKRKILLLVMACSIFFSACSTDKVFNISSKAEENEGDTSRIEDVEEDVNGVDIKEDEELTQRAEDENVTEEDILIPQEEVEEDIDLENEEKKEVLNGQRLEEYIVVNDFNTVLSDGIYQNIKYDKYPTSYNYLLVLSKKLNIREEPTTNSKILRKAVYFEKMNLVKGIKGEKLKKYNSDLWYKVFWKEEDQLKYGYVFSALAEAREFQFDKMENALDTLKNEVEKNQTAYIANYKNRNGKAPLYNGKTNDAYGERRYQSVPAYIDPNLQSEFRYIADGTLVSVLEEKESFYKITTLNFEGVYWIPKKYVSFRNHIEKLKKVVVVDRKNQNEGVFEYIDNKWHLISYVFATTGENAKHKLETPLGYYMAIEKKSKFLYLDDETRKIAGYAPFAIRFTGGSYIHGVPVDYKIVNDKRVDPGMKEYLFTIGTVPRSHRCVRNYTSHAKFLHDWITIGESSVVVIE